MGDLLVTIVQGIFAALGVMVFWQFRVLVDEVKELRREIHFLNLKIAEILASDKMFEHRLQLLENKQERGRYEN